MTVADFDAVVVGSGPNGLAAAITMAARGWSVLVCEAAPQLGGAVITEELTLPGFRHDVFSSVYPAGAASPVFADLPLGRYGLHWVQPEVAMAHPGRDGRAHILDRDLGRTAARLDELAAGDGQRWTEFVQPLLANFSALRDTLFSAFPPLWGPARLAGRLGLSGALELARTVLLPAEQLAAELFRGELAAGWLCGSALHGDVPPTGTGSAVTALYLQLLGHAVGWPSPQGGAGRLSGALAAHFGALGGHSAVRTRVQRVQAERGRVVGCELAGGEAVATRVVICDTTPHGLLSLAGAQLPADYAAKLARYRYGSPTFKVDWALDAPVPWRSGDARRAGTVHVGGTPGAITAALDTVRAHRLAERPFLLFGQQSVADPTRAPAGKHTAWAYTHVPDGVTWSPQLSGSYADTVEEQVERFAPGFRERILARHVLTPPAFAQRDVNLVAGDVGGGSYALDQLIFRPVPSLNPYRTPVRGLYLGSAAAFPGGAVHGVPGRAAARLALAEGSIRRLTRR